MILVYIISLIILSFAEFIFVGFGIGSLILPIAFLLFEKRLTQNRTLAIGVIILFIFDVGFALPIGSYLLSIFVGCLLFYIISRFSQLHNKIIRVAVIFIIIFVMNLILCATVWSFNFMGIFASSIFSTLWFSIFEYLYDNLRNGEVKKIKI